MSVDVLKALAQCAEDGVRQDRLLLELSTAIISKFETLMARPYPTQAARLGAILELQPSELLEPAADEPPHAA